MANAIQGHFVWYEHMTRDTPAAEAFYTAVIGWKTQPFPEGDNYVMWTTSQGPMGGLHELSEEACQAGASPNWMAHVLVDDVDATVAKAKALGGKVHCGPQDIPTVGRFAVLADPLGAVLSVYKPLRAMSLHDGRGEGEFCWSELLTSDNNSAFEFYAALFGWTVQKETNMGDVGPYRIFAVGEQAIGGVMNAPPNLPMPSVWLHYINVKNLDETLAQATKLGAKLMTGPMPIPGGGQIAHMTDPQGAVFALHQAP